MIKAGNLQMQDGSIISTATVGAGSGGNITINIDRQSERCFLFPRFHRIRSGMGTGGDITVTAKNITIRGDQASIDANCWTDIAAQTFGSGQGGSITIRADNLRCWMVVLSPLISCRRKLSQP